MPLLPVLYAGVGAVGAACLDEWRVRGSGRPTLQGLGVAAAGIVGLLIVLHPLTSLQTYYEQVLRIGRTNARVFQTIDLIKANRPAGEVVLIDRQLDRMVLGRGAGRPGSAFRLGLALAGIPYQMGDPEALDDLLDPANRCRDQLVILGSRRPIVNEELVAKLDLRDLEHRPAQAHNQASLYGLYRLDRLRGSACP